MAGFSHVGIIVLALAALILCSDLIRNGEAAGSASPAPAIVEPDVSASDQVIGQPAGPAPTPRHTGVKALIKDLGSDFAHLPSKENLFWTGVGGASATTGGP